MPRQSRRLRLRYPHESGDNAPVILVHGNLRKTPAVKDLDKESMGMYLLPVYLPETSLCERDSDRVAAPNKIEGKKTKATG